MNPIFVTTACFKSTYNWGGTVIENICAGTTNTIKWGSIDWTFYGLAYLAGAALAISFIAAAVKAVINYNSTDEDPISIKVVSKK